MLCFFTLSANYLWYLILRGQQKTEDTKTYANAKLLPIFQRVGTKIRAENGSSGKKK